MKELATKRKAYRSHLERREIKRLTVDHPQRRWPLEAILRELGEHVWNHVADGKRCQGVHPNHWERPVRVGHPNPKEQGKPAVAVRKQVIQAPTPPLRFPCLRALIIHNQPILPRLEVLLLEARPEEARWCVVPAPRNIDVDQQPRQCRILMQSSSVLKREAIEPRRSVYGAVLPATLVFGQNLSQCVLQK